MKLVSLKYDYAFRELFSHEGIRKQFISDVTGIPLEDIKAVRLTTPFLWRRYQKQKQGILDVAVILNDETRVDIELQVQMQKYWCVTISLLDFQLIE